MAYDRADWAEGNKEKSQERVRRAAPDLRAMQRAALSASQVTGMGRSAESSTSDITARKNMEQQFRHDAFYDTLTGLPNRSLFLDQHHSIFC